MFTPMQLLKIASSESATDETKWLANYCIELRNVLAEFVDVEECDIEDGTCYVHGETMFKGNTCPHQRAKDLMPYGDMFDEN